MRTIIDRMRSHPSAVRLLLWFLLWDVSYRLEKISVRLVAEDAGGMISCLLLSVLGLSCTILGCVFLNMDSKRFFTAQKTVRLIHTAEILLFLGFSACICIYICLLSS